MQITHQFKNTKIIKKVDENVGLILGNDLGDYFYMTDEEETRYQGFFYADGKMHKNQLLVYKIIDKINILENSELTEIKNSFFDVSKNYNNGLTEKYFLPNGHDSLCMKTNRKVKAEIILDVRHPYDNRQMGRFYEIKLNKEYALIKYTKRRDWQEDGLGDKKEFTAYIAIKTDVGNYNKIGDFFSKYYGKDNRRNSLPCDRFVYKALKIEFNEAVFSVAKTPDKAIEEVNKVYRNFDRLYEKEVDNIHKKLKFPKISDEEIKMAYLCAQNSIYTLLVENNSKNGAYAGLPWFFQFWTRDEAISLLEISKLNNKLANEIIGMQIKLITSDGQIPKQRFFEQESNGPKSADAIGWLMDRILKLAESNKLTEDIRMEVVEKIEKVISGLIQKRTVDELAVNFNNETWMDSLERSGKRLEIQACRLKIYSALFKLTNNDQYKLLEQELKKKILEKFYEDGMLYDSPDDKVIRPNLFIAAYIYPDLLDIEQWKVCFDKALDRLYLNWGGISTIDVTRNEFIRKDTGENSASYHNGNSWYWINNLTALVLYRFDPHRYSRYINTIMETNTREILYKGIVGHHSEISSAENQSCAGCGAQLWSAAMYLEVFDEMLKN